jgi:subtilase family serine protease
MRNCKFVLFLATLAVAACKNGGDPLSMPPAGEPNGYPLRLPVASAVCASVHLGAVRCGVILQSLHVYRATLAGLTPAQLEAAYNLPSTKGKGQIVAVVDAFDNPNVASDLATYRSTFGLPKANFSKYNQNGRMNHYPKGDKGWGVQIDQDVEMVSASCPNCTLYLIEANGNDPSDFQTAEAQAVKLGAHIVSNSWICYGSETCVGQSYFNTPGVTYLAMSGNNGFDQLGAPGVFDSVVAVGGTMLTQGGGGTRGWTESTWPSSGGGCSTQPKPPWQHDRQCAHRLADDVSAVAENVAEYDSYGYGGWFTVAGTSIGTGFLAGVFGLAGNATKQDGGRTFWQVKHHSYLYEVKVGSKYVRYSEGTGWGTPNGVGAF